MSEPNDDLEKLRRAFAAIPAVAPAPETCPASESILAAVRGELPPAELRAVIEHIAACPACAEDWRLAAALERPFGDDSATAAAPRTEALRGRYRRLAAWCASVAAAAALLVAGLLSRAPVSDLRGGGETVQLLTQDDVLPREACVLRWSPLPGAAYDFDIYFHDQREKVVDQARGLREPRYQVPAAKLAGVPPATALSWRVTANFPDRRSRVSKIGTFVLR